LNGAEAVAEIETTGGATFKARCDHPKGAPENPLSRAEIEDKLRVYAEDRLPAARISDVIAAVNRLEELANVRELMDMLRQGPLRRRGERAA
jgi:2-methylcitrate dehydratase PrpD